MRGFRPSITYLGYSVTALAGLGLLFLGSYNTYDPLPVRDSSLTFDVVLPEEVAHSELWGRLVLLIGANQTTEPRLAFGRGAAETQGFGLDVEGWAPGTVITFDGSEIGYPLGGLEDLPPGQYLVQAVLNRYDTFRRADGHEVLLPRWDMGEGQAWNRKPGNLYSAPLEVTIYGDREKTITIVLEREIPAVPEFERLETDYIKYFSMRSELLSEFWGEDIYLGAWVLLPHGFDENPNARYPLAVWQGHFPSAFSGWRESPPDPDLECDYSQRFRLDCYNRTEEEEAWRLFQLWTGPDVLRHIVIQMQHPTPYFSSSYVVNSENNGPYGDALTYELIPAIEAKFRGIGEGWARFLYGGSTGGWTALAAQVFYPDEYNGAWASCPDPITFEAMTAVNLYEDDNAYFQGGAFRQSERSGFRDYRGLMQVTLREINLHEAVLGSRGRSGQQWDIWQAAFSPVAEDGYPAPIWDKLTGEIDAEVAEHWRENYDLVHILRRDWEDGLGERLQGKINLNTGTLDNYYLENAVYIAEEFLRGTTQPYFEGEILYGEGKEHCWNGHPTLPNAVSRLRYIEMHAPKILERIEASAPPGADLSSWRY